VTRAAPAASVFVQPGDAVEGRAQEWRWIGLRDEGNCFLVDLDKDLFCVRRTPVR
jgi:hypothetical protein